MGVQTGRLSALPLRSEGIFGQGHSDKLQIVNEQNIKCRCNDLSGSFLITRGKGKFQSRAEVFILFPSNLQISIAGRTSRQTSLVIQANITPLVKGGARVTDFAISEPWSRFWGFRTGSYKKPANPLFIGTERV
jgi:hypothetical protein